MQESGPRVSSAHEPYESHSIAWCRDHESLPAMRPDDEEGFFWRGI